MNASGYILEARRSAGRFSRDSENTQPAWRMQI